MQTVTNSKVIVDPVLRERRRRRSDNTAEALAFQLQHVAEVLELNAIVLTDDLGQVLARAGDAFLCNILADSVMWSDEDDAPLDEMTVEWLAQHAPDLDPSFVVRERLDIPGASDSARVLAIGRSWGRGAGVEHACEGVVRILGEAVERRRAATGAI